MLKSPDYPEVLRHIPSKPKQLYHTGAPLDDMLKRPRVTIVGTRRMTDYGEQITRKLATELAEQGIIIISGLASGVDYVAHNSAVKAGGLCIAVLPSPLDNIVPTTSRRLADRILKKGGALVSEYAPGEPTFKQYFIARNRIMSGLAQIVLITEAGEKSGALYTANFAKEQGIDVMAVPGNIDQIHSEGCNNLIKTGAGLVTEATDILHGLGLEPHKTKAKRVRGRNTNEQKILDLMLEGINQGDVLLEKSGMDIIHFNQVITMLEIDGKIRPLGANNWAIY